MAAICVFPIVLGQIHPLCRAASADPKHIITNVLEKDASGGLPPVFLKRKEAKLQTLFGKSGVDGSGTMPNIEAWSMKSMSFAVHQMLLLAAGHGTWAAMASACVRGW